MAGFGSLFKPAYINGIKLRNVIVMPAMLTGLASPNGEVTERLASYYRERAAGGAGLIVVELANIESLNNRHLIRQLSIGDDRFVPSLARLAEAIHSHKSLAAIQINHLGRYSSPEISGTAPLSPSDEAAQSPWPESRAMNKEQIERVGESFAKAARRAQEAGFDAIELQAAHGYLICQFISPLTNRRADEYGGNIEGRVRFLAEVLVTVRQAVGSKFPVIVRLSADEFVDGGITLDDTLAIAKRVEKDGADALSISVGSRLSKIPLSIPSMAYKPGCLVKYAASVHNSVDIPVIAVGRINSPYLAEKVLEEDKADLIAMGRALIADPDLPNKAEAGDIGRIRQCIGCNHCIELAVQKGDEIRCSVNARAGRELEFPIRNMNEKKKVFIIGGGPGGLEAAREVAARGHEVVLYEKAKELGGQILIASKPPYKEGLLRLVEYYKDELSSLNVKIYMDKGIEHVHDLEELPDTIIFATGSIPYVPEIRGIYNDIVVPFTDLLLGSKPIGDSVVVLGGGQIGIEVAALLARRRKSVTITRRKETLGEGMTPSLRKAFLDYLDSHKVNIFTGIEYVEINDQGVLIEKDAKRIMLNADRVVLAAGRRSEPLRLHEWREANVEPYVVGDCVEPRDIISAVREGFETGYAV